MKFSSSLILLIFACTTVLATNISKAEMCMYDSVLHMSSAGQKIAFQVTRTVVSDQPFKLPKGATIIGNSSTTTHTETHTSTHTNSSTITKKVTSFKNLSIDKDTGAYDENTKNKVPSSVSNKGPIESHIFDRDWKTYTDLSDNWISEHGGWTDFCARMRGKCHNKRGLHLCRSWERRCIENKFKWKWTVKQGVVITDHRYETKHAVVSIKYKKIPRLEQAKDKCMYFRMNRWKAVCMRRNKRGKCAFWKRTYKVKKCIERKNITFKRFVENYAAHFTKAYSADWRKLHVPVDKVRQEWYACKAMRRKKFSFRGYGASFKAKVNRKICSTIKERRKAVSKIYNKK